MDIRTLEERLHVSPQIRLEDLPSLAARGYGAVISNRPDGEEPDQPTSDQVRQAAEAAGLAFVHIPVRGAFPAEDVARFSQALETLPGPVFGFCRSGTRTTFMWALSQAGQRPADEIIARAAAAGYDVSPVATQLEG